MELSEFLIENEPVIRLSFFIGGFLLFLLIGLLFPFRPMKSKKMMKRWLNNSLLTFANSFLLKALMPFTVVFIAQEYSSRGLLSFWAELKTLYIILGIIVLDLTVYWQHRIFHVVPFLWRLHRVHHTDTEFDVTTALRFHTIEIFLSYFIKALVIVSLGITFESVIIFEVVLNFCAMFNHGNYKLPSLIEKVTRLFIVTPSMHRIHHSVVKEETNSNYGFCLSVWDKVFGSYVHNPKEDPKSMNIGIETFRNIKDQDLFQLLAQPFKEKGV